MLDRRNDRGDIKRMFGIEYLGSFMLTDLHVPALKAGELCLVVILDENYLADYIVSCQAMVENVAYVRLLAVLTAMVRKCRF